MILGAEVLLNTLNSIVRKPGRTYKFLVSSKSQSILHTCVQNKFHVTCDCRGYRSKLSCHHSLAVAFKQNIFQNHLDWLNRQQKKTNKSAILSMKKPGIGQKGEGRPKSRLRTRRPLSTEDTMSTRDSDYDAVFTKYYHNNEKFRVIKKQTVRKDRYKCWHCNQAFEEIIPGPPHNIVLWHRGAWEYPIDRDNPGPGKRISSSYTDYYYHIKRSCIRARYLYFLPHMVLIQDDVVLNIAQRALLASELKYTFE